MLLVELQAAGTHTHLPEARCAPEGPSDTDLQEKVSSAAGIGEPLHRDGQRCSIHECSQGAWRSLMKGAMQYTCEVLLFLLHRFIKFNEDIEGFH